RRAPRVSDAPLRFLASLHVSANPQAAAGPLPDLRARPGRDRPLLAALVRAQARRQPRARGRRARRVAAYDGPRAPRERRAGRRVPERRPRLEYRHRGDARSLGRPVSDVHGRRAVWRALGAAVRERGGGALRLTELLGARAALARPRAAAHRRPARRTG